MDQRRIANERFRLADKHLRRAVALKPETDSEALNYLANIALHFKRYDEAIGFINKAVSDINYAKPFAALGTRARAHLEKGDATSAARDLRQALFHESRFCLGRYWLAKVHYKKARYKECIDELRKVVGDKRCPIQDAYHLLGLALMKHREPERARVEFQRCVTHNPKSCIAEECKRYARLI